jgi:L-threonylcarbamoyladenylate synthase
LLISTMPNTLHLDAAVPADISRAAELLRSGHLVAFATETVYGLGANALSVDAVSQIFAAKQRPSWDPLIVHLASAEQLPSITSIPAALAPRISHLVSAFWPGPLTLLLPRNQNIPDAVTAGRELVGVRIPAHPAAQALLGAVELPIAAPSANLFGHTSPTTAAHVLADLNGRIDAVLDAGPTTIGLESTVLDPTTTPMTLYRPGAITPAQLTTVAGVAVTIFTPTISDTPPESLPSPGVGIRHYAPRATLQLTDGNPIALNSALQVASSSHRIGVLLPNHWMLTYIKVNPIIQRWAPWDEPEALAASLFSVLRALDDQGATLILCPLPPPGGLADAIRDRLQKAARP